LFGDLDAWLNARADYYEKKDADPGFMGFRRIERSLAAGGDMRSLAPVGDRLLADIATLKERLATLELRPEQLTDLSAKQVRRLSESLAAAGNDSPADVQAVHEATTKVADLLSPLLAKANPALDKAIRADLAALDRSLARTSANAVFDAAQRKAAAGALSRLADDLGKVNAALGLA
jgi:iron uptake system component EfeO